MSILDFLLGRPIPTSEERGEQIGVAAGVPIFGLDALGSAAYGPEAALTLLIPLGLAGLAYILPLSAAIIVLLAIVYFSYRQTIAAYPQGGGSYIVARQNLGTFPGLLAGAALLLDYSLDAAVGIAAGVGALTSAVPSLHPRTLPLCLLALLILTVGLGATATGFTVIVIILAKFTEGAWITIIAIPGLLALMYGKSSHALMPGARWGSSSVRSPSCSLEK